MGWIFIFSVVRLKAPKNDRADLVRSTWSLVLPPLGSRMRRVSASCSTRTPSTVRTSLAAPGHPSGDRGFIAALVEGVGQLEAHPAELQQQLVGGVRLVLDVKQDLHDAAQGRHVPEVRLDAGLRRRSAQGLLELLLLGAGELGGVLITRVPGHHRAQPGRPPARRPVPNRSLTPVNHLGNNTHVNTTKKREERPRPSIAPEQTSHRASSTSEEHPALPSSHQQARAHSIPRFPQLPPDTTPECNLV